MLNILIYCINYIKCQDSIVLPSSNVKILSYYLHQMSRVYCFTYIKCQDSIVLPTSNIKILSYYLHQMSRFYRITYIKCQDSILLHTSNVPILSYYRHKNLGSYNLGGITQLALSISLSINLAIDSNCRIRSLRGHLRYISIYGDSRACRSH